jgi:hypothetical protein
MITKNIVVGGGGYNAYRVGYEAYQALRGVPSKLIDLSQAPFVLKDDLFDVSIGRIDTDDWRGFVINTEENTILWYPEEAIIYNGPYLACCDYNNAITIIVRLQDTDTREDLTLRVWHELLHYHGQPADDMDLLIQECVGAWDLFIYPIAKYFRKNYYERKFYEYLTGRV